MKSNVTLDVCLNSFSNVKNCKSAISKYFFDKSLLINDIDYSGYHNYYTFVADRVNEYDLYLYTFFNNYSVALSFVLF